MIQHNPTAPVLIMGENKISAFSGGWWCPQKDLNLRPTDYKSRLQNLISYVSQRLTRVRWIMFCQNLAKTNRKRNYLQSTLFSTDPQIGSGQNCR